MSEIQALKITSVRLLLFDILLLRCIRSCYGICYVILCYVITNI